MNSVQSPDKDQAIPKGPGNWHWWTLVLIAVSAIFHLGYLWVLCPIQISTDEAHYWDWSRHLDWSYYSKGPLVAWLIRLDWELFGSLSQNLTGSLMPGLRTGAVFFGAATLLALHQLARAVFKSDKVGFFLVAIALTLPPIHVLSLLLTIDAPYCCIWAWALVTARKALIAPPGQGRGMWLLTGVLVGLGILAKYTMVIFAGSLFLALAMQPQWRRKLLEPWPWLGAGLAAAFCAPILIWNISNDWVTFKHVGNLAGVDQAGKGIQWLGPIRFLGGQAALLLFFWFVIWCMALTKKENRQTTNPDTFYLWIMSWPVFAVFLGFSPKTGGGEINWPITAYLSGLPLAAKLVMDAWNKTGEGTNWIRKGAVGTGTIGLGLTFFILYSSLFYPLISRVVSQPGESNPTPIRRLDPTCRLKGWKQLAQEVDKIRDSLGERAEVVICGNRWSTTGVLGFYCKGHPQAYCLGPVLGDRHSQYDFWLNPFDHPEQFKGKTFVVVDGVESALREAFDSIDPPVEFKYSEYGQPIAKWNLLVCRNFKGFEKQKITNRGW